MTLKFSPGAHRYWLDKKPIPGVTTLIKQGFPNTALMYWSARSVAEFVADNKAHMREVYEWMDRAQLVAMLKETPWSQRDKAAVKGTEVHDLAEKLIAGERVEIPDHLEGYVQACVDFLDTWRVRELIVECSVAHRAHWWAGRPDLIGQLPDGRTALFDWKSGSGIYPETAYQLAAYSHAEFWTPDGELEEPLPPIDFCAAVHLRPDGYDVIPVKADDDVYAEFLSIKAVADAAKRAKGNKTTPGYVGDPMPAPSLESVA